MLVPYHIMQYYVITILESENDLQGLKYLLKHSSSSATSALIFMSGHPYHDFIVTTRDVTCIYNECGQTVLCILTVP